MPTLPLEFMERFGYGFSQSQRDYVHKRSKSCEFPDGCNEHITGKVNHLTGVFLARMDGLDKKSITNPDHNALLLCWEYEKDLDKQEKYQQECLLYEKGSPIHIGENHRRNKKKRGTKPRTLHRQRRRVDRSRVLGNNTRELPQDRRESQLDMATVYEARFDFTRQGRWDIYDAGLERIKRSKNRTPLR